MDLISLGILPGTSKVEVHETQTVQILSAIARRIPSADEATLEKHLDKTKRKTENEQSSSSLDDHDAVSQLKSLIRLLPNAENRLAMNDQKTEEIFELLLHHLKTEEEKTVQQMERSEAQRIHANPPDLGYQGKGGNTSDEWIDILADELTAEISADTSAPSEDDDSCADDIDLSGEPIDFKGFEEDGNNLFSGKRINVVATAATTSAPDSVEFDSHQLVPPSGHEAARPRQETTPEESFYDSVPNERRLKRERRAKLKQSSSSSFVVKLLSRIESNQKAKRKEKRERRKEKKLERAKKLR